MAKKFLLVAFENGGQVVYKPSISALDYGWQNLVRWMEERGAPSAAALQKCSMLVNYGWMEYVETTDTDSAKAEFLSARRDTCWSIF